MSMPCWGCTSAQVNPRTGYFVSECDECCARSLAQSPQFANSMAANVLVPTYRAALQAIFGDGWLDGHAKVKAAAERLK